VKVPLPHQGPEKPPPVKKEKNIKKYVEHCSFLKYIQEYRSFTDVKEIDFFRVFRGRPHLFSLFRKVFRRPEKHGTNS
jgi:hypothetical protein